MRDLPSAARRAVTTGAAALTRNRTPLPKTAAQLRTAFQRDAAAGHPLATINRLGLNGVTSLLARPGSGFRPANRIDISIVQTYLRSKGFKITDPRGSYGDTTHRALISAYQQARASEQRKFESSIRSVFYSSGILKAGQAAPAWLPSSTGRTPTAAELAHLLQRGGFTAAMVSKALARQLKAPDVRFRIVRRIELDRIYHSLAGPHIGPSFVKPTAFQRMATIFLHPALADPRAQAEVKALYNATTVADYQRLLGTYSRTAVKRQQILSGRGPFHLDPVLQKSALAKIDAQERAALLGQARAHRSWFASTLNSWEHFLDRQRVEQVGNLIHLVHDPVGYVLHHDANHEQYVERAGDWIDGLNFVSHFTFEMLTDPINYVPFGKAGKIGAKLLTRGTEAAGRGLIHTAEGELFAAMDRFGVGSTRAVVAVHSYGEALVKLGEHAFYVPAAKRLVLDGLAAGRLTAPMYRAVHLATRTKRAATDAARNKVLHAAAHGYRPTPIASRSIAKPAGAATIERRVSREVAPAPAARPAARPSAPAVPEVAAHLPLPPHPVNSRTLPQNPKVVEQLDRTAPVLEAKLQTHARQLIATLQETSASLWSNVVRVPHYYSSVGASLRARMVNVARNAHAHEMARHYADDVAEGYLARVSREEGIDLSTAALRAQHPQVVAEMVRLANEEYRRVIHGVGVYRHGSADPELYAALQRRVAVSAQTIDEAILPALQDALDSFAEQRGNLLYGPDGSWLHSQGAGQEALRGAARESFTSEIQVDNPLFGKLVDSATARGLAEEEIRTRTSALKQYFAREVERGNPNELSQDWLDGQVSQIEDEVHSAWQPVRSQEDGKLYYQDTREKIGVSPLYAGHLEESLNVSYKDAIGNLDQWERNLTTIGLPKSDTLGTKIDEEIGNIVWSFVRANDPGYGVSYATWREGVGKFTALAHDERVGLERAISSRQIALTGAYHDVYSRSLVGEGALYAALQHAQSRPLRVLHTALAGHLAIWRFATLPLSPAWRFRNVVDNTAKSLVEGVRDPRAYFPSWLAKGVHGELARIQTVFDHNLNAVAAFAKQLDGLLGTEVEPRLRALIDTFWDHTTETIDDILRFHDIEVPGTILSETKGVTAAGVDPLRKELGDLTSVDLSLQRLEAIGVDEDLIEVAALYKKLTPEERLAQRSQIARFKDWVWDVMGNRPEDAARRRVYQFTYYHQLETYKAAGVPAIEAERKAFFDAAARVEKVLFDYSKISVLEHNLSIFFPFVQFWRKNSGFWLRTAVDKPWVPTSIAQWEEERQRVNEDWPEWMRRYVPAKAVTDVAARVPGLGWLASVGVENLFYDPLNFFSFRPLYGLFKEAMGFDNPNFPTEKLGWAFLAPLVDAVEQAGLGMNPLFRQPLEHLGVLNQRSWRQVLPQTTFIAALTRDFISEHVADIILDLDGAFADPIITSINALGGGGKLPHEVVGDHFNELVELEMVNQLARGETPSRARAERKLRGYYLTQAVVGTFFGAWMRVATPEDIWLSKLTEKLAKDEIGWASLTPREKTLITARGYARHGNPNFDLYVDNLPLVQAFYKLHDHQAREEFKQQHPQILPFVDPVWKGDPLPADQLRNTLLASDTQTVKTLHRLFKEGHVAPEVRAAADSVLITPELEKFWHQNDTPAERRDAARRGAYYKRLDTLAKGYFAIPKTDYAARRDYLQRHPELVDYWNENNSDADDFKVIANGILQGFRDIYFNYADQHDWANANKLLKEHPYLFDKFVDDRYVVDRQTGRPRAGNVGEFNRGGLTEHARAYLTAKPGLDHFFSIVDTKGRQAAFDWLNHAGTLEAQAVIDYFAAWGKPPTAKAKAYAAAKDDIDYYQALAKQNPEYARQWLQSNDPSARRVREYFGTYANAKPKTRKARDYLRAKTAVERYFGIKDPKARAAWLSGSTPQAKLARWYFNKYPPARGSWQTVRDEGGGTRRIWVPDYKAIQTRDYIAAKPALDSYFKVPVAQRAAWLARNTPEARAALAYFQKYADTTKQTAHGIAYGAAKADLDRYFKLTPEQRRSFLASGSASARRVLDYFTKYGDPVAGSRSRLRRILQHAAGPALHTYYNLPAQDRADWLKGNGADQVAARAWFDSHGGVPSGRPTTAHAVDYVNAKPGLDVYFGMPQDQRSAWLRSGDPLAKLAQDYFDKYLSIRGITRQSIDYAISRRGLDTYFSLPPAQRAAWLRSGNPDAALVLHYFKTYSKMNTLARSFRRSTPSRARTFRHSRSHDKRRRGSRGSRPSTIERHVQNVTDVALRQRLGFWQRFFDLPADQRPGFLHKHAQEAGVFVNGNLGDQQEHDAELEAKAKSHIRDDNPYWQIKPFLDLYNSLPPGDDRDALLKGNPELAAYLAGAPDALNIGSEVAGYLKLPTLSELRASYLAAHPGIADIFDVHASPAIRQLLDSYFLITDSVQRKAFLAQHPEIQDYFDLRNASLDLRNKAYFEWAASDPYLRPFHDRAIHDVGGAAERMRFKLALERTRSRRPATLARRNVRSY